MKKVGVIEIGSYSIRLLLTEIEEGGYFKIIDELNSSVEICKDLIDDNSICSCTINSIISTIKSFKSLCDISGADKVYTVATDVFRKSTNQQDVIDAIEKETGIQVDILPWESEIRYITLAILRSIYISNSLVVEISSTTTNLAWLKNGNIKESVSLPFGSVDLSYKFKLTNRISQEDYEALIDYLDTEITNIPWLFKNRFESVIGVGITIRTLGKIDRLRKRYPFDISHNYELTDMDVHEILNLLKCKDCKQRSKMEGLDDYKAEILIGGISIFHSIIKVLTFDKIFISGRGLREGIIYKHIQKNYKPIEDILDYSINGILDTLNSNKVHANHVYYILLSLFEQLKPLHNLGSDYNHIIKTSALLHDSGISVNYYNHHKHSFYVILYSYINGLSHKELLMSAAIAASHRFNQYQLPYPPYSSILSKLDLQAIEKIGVLLKIAEGLDRGLVSAVKTVHVKYTSEEVIIELTSNRNLEFEIHQALRAALKFKELYRRRLIIRHTENK